jgi:hypothetical protein
MTRRARTIGMMVLWGAAVHSNLAQGQSPQPTTLVIDINNYVEYQDDTPDSSKYATNSKITPSTPPKNFFVATALADIVAVNGQPARGAFVQRSRAVILSPAPGTSAVAEAISDVTRAAVREQIFEIQQADGTPVGTIVGLGLSGGPNPPGAPLAQLKGNWAIVGGTGAFLGARGQEGIGQNTARAASMMEDPADRRINGGGTARYFLSVIPMVTPEIVQTPDGPAVAHSSDFSLVTKAKPAAAGEILSLFTNGLGPTIPEVDPGQPFPTGVASAVNSPIQVMVNGKPAQVLGAVGYPGTTDGYQVNFRVPPDAAKGATTIQVVVAWIAGTPVSVAVQ